MTGVVYLVVLLLVSALPVVAGLQLPTSAPWSL